MRLFKTLLLVVVMCMVLPTHTLAQNTSTQGKEFWLTFMHNGFKEHPLGGWITNQVLISAKRDCSGTISNPKTGWSVQFNVNANSITTVDIPIEQGYHDRSNYSTVSKKAIHIVSTDTISAYCTNIAYVSFDASFVLPTESLGDDYIIQSFNQSRLFLEDVVNVNQTSAFAIVATEDNTDIDITPSCTTLDGMPAGQTFQITLNAGETYQVRSNNYETNRDLSGTRITASDCKKIAVFNGNTLTCIPTNQGDGFDHVFEQAMPLRSWGKRFAVTGSANRNRDFVKVTSSADYNQIYKNGDRLTSLNANQSYIFELDSHDGSCFIESTHPCAVYLYNTSCYDDTNSELGDPSMVWIAPVEQVIDEVNFSTFDNATTGISVHYVNIIVNSNDINNVYLDNRPIASSDFEPIRGNNEFSFTRKNITHGSHHLSCSNGFNAHVYGFGRAKGYAYLVGSNAIDLSTSVTINEVSVNPNESYAYCSDQGMTFLADINFSNYSLQWDFGDGSTSTDNPAVHTYHDNLVYTVTLTVNSDGSGCDATAAHTFTYYVDLTQHYIMENDESCTGEFYSGHGFNNVLINNDTILVRMVDNPDHPECQDSLLLYLTARPSYHIPFNDSRCWQGEPGVYNGYGFSFEYNAPGEYNRQLELQSVDGCDSIVFLHLIVADRITTEVNHHECNGSYTWDGDIYTTPGTYEKLYTTLDGCDSIVTLHLTMGTNQESSFDTISCGTFHWNGQEYDQSGDYTQVLTTYDGCDSTVLCHLLVSAPVDGATTKASECNSYTWYDVDYTESGIYTKVFQTYLGCDSILYLDLDLNYTPDPKEITSADFENPAPHWVITASEFDIHSYDFIFEDRNPNCRWDSIEWAIDTPEALWILEPDMTTQPPGKVCTMIVRNSLPDTIWIHATAYNECNPQGVERRYWFLCSFYALEENSAEVQFDIVPNPNNGQMDLLFKHLEGKADVKVYDMRGTLIDHFQAYNGTGSSTYPYTMKSAANGIYYFVITGKDGVLTKKVIIAR